ncbi:MAG: transposase [Rhodanobacteraceae bacterium]
MLSASAEQSPIETRCALHAYVLMDNHVHLLPTPPETVAIARMMHKLGAATSSNSMPASSAHARCEKAATRPVWSTAESTCCAAAATSISIRFAPA